MSTATAEPVEMGTKPVQEHEWLQNLVGEWRVETEMWMGPGEPKQRAEGTESVKSLGGLWAFSEGRATMPNGAPMLYYNALGYDVSFKEYRGCWIAAVSSHLWKKVGTLSADGKTMTLNCVGPNMEKDGETANYRDVIQLLDRDHLTVTSYGENENGEWQEHMKSTYTRSE
jgi:hypothetical protein